MNWFGFTVKHFAFIQEASGIEPRKLDSVTRTTRDFLSLAGVLVLSLLCSLIHSTPVNPSKHILCKYYVENWQYLLN
jgi:hypothetical protein